MAGHFPLYTDADVHGPLILALRRRGWDLVRAIDLYPPGTADAVHFERAARDSRVLISNDPDMEVIGELVASIEALSEPFPHPVIHLRPPR